MHRIHVWTCSQKIDYREFQLFWAKIILGSFFGWPIFSILKILENSNVILVPFFHFFHFLFGLISLISMRVNNRHFFSLFLIFGHFFSLFFIFFKKNEKKWKKVKKIEFSIDFIKGTWFLWFFGDDHFWPKWGNLWTPSKSRLNGKSWIKWPVLIFSFFSFFYKNI